MTYEENKVEEETDTLHSLTTVKLVINQERSHVVTNECDGDVDQVPEPSSHDALAIRVQDLDESRLEELVAVECEIVGEPCTGGSDNSSSEVAEDELERLDIVAGLVHSCVLLGLLESGTRIVHSVVSVVDEPEGHERHDSELYPEGPLC